MSAGTSGFTDLPDLAARRLGGMVLAANDEFFAPKENLLKPEQPAFDPDRYTDRGKEMDGWETRRRRTEGHDWCVVRLGVPGIVRGVVVDTSFFRGNYPERCSLDAVAAPDDDLEAAEWFELVPETALEGDARNQIEVTSPLRITHLRFNIFPDGGVARLRVHGEPLPDLRRVVDPDGQADVAATLAGGIVLDASDRFFSSPHNLIAPGDSYGMHDGWETRRRRGPGHDWVEIALGAETEIDRVEVDTTNFKGNYPDTCSLDTRTTRDAPWSQSIAAQKLGPHERFDFPVDPPAAATEVRFNVHPDGGVARLRVLGRVTDEGWRSFGVRWLNALTESAFEREVLPCCASPAWARELASARPFPDFASIEEASDAAWGKCAEEDRRAAFDAHPRIGDRSGSSWSQQEQAASATADDHTVRELESANRDYEARFGHVFLINATGKSSGEVLHELRRRMGNDPEAELAEAAEQQRQITRVRLEKLVRP